MSTAIKKQNSFSSKSVLLDLFKRQISKEIALVFQNIGKTNQYFLKHPTHALRHIGAQYWLAKKDFNYGLAQK